MTRHLRLGTRASPLALAQARLVKGLLTRTAPDTRVTLHRIRTEGDEESRRQRTRPLAHKDLFTARIEQRLREGTIDAAVHSLKDLPYRATRNLLLAAFPDRQDPRDALVARTGGGIGRLREGARVGTSSMRRRSQILARRPDLQIQELHGNVGRRVANVTSGAVDATVLALAGLRRLGLAHHVGQVLAPSVMMPAPGQGTLAVQVRADDPASRALVARIDDPTVRARVVAERTLARRLGVGPDAPLGALATVRGNALRLRAAVTSPDGRRRLEADAWAPMSDAGRLGLSMADRLRGQGAKGLMGAAS